MLKAPRCRPRCRLRASRREACGLAPQHEGGLQAKLAPPLPERAQAQRVEADEAFGVALVVGGAFLEGHEILVVERIFALAADDRHIALVELEPHPAGDEFL